MLGKAKCKILKEIRQKIADENDIPYVTRECTYQGDCSGTCPRCESELRYLERELEARRRIGKQVAVTALCAGISFGTAGCSSPDQGQELGGATTVLPEPTEVEMSGDVAYVPEGGSEAEPTPIELEGDVEYFPQDGEGELSGDVAYVPELAGEAEVWDVETCPANGEAIKTAENAFDGLVSFAGTGNKGAVLNGARYCPMFIPEKDVKLCALTTQHWNEGMGAIPGLIRIYDITDGEENLLGTWEVTTRDEDGVENVKWDIFPEITLQEGHIYNIVDSDPATWSTNSGADEMGFVELFTDAETDVEGIFTPYYGN